MRILEGILIALEALWANKLRTVLTLLGNIVGVMSVIAVVSIIDGMNGYIRDEVAEEGTGVFILQRINELDILSDFDKYLKSLHNPKITLRDLTRLRERVTFAQYMDASLSSRADARNGRRYIKAVSVLGRSENYPFMGKWELSDGRHFSLQEIRRRRSVAVIGSDIANRLYPGVDPVGKDIKVAGINNRVIGVLSERPGSFGSNPNLRVVIPISSFQKIFGSQQSLEVTIKTASLESVDECVDQVRVTMRSYRHLGPREEDNFAIVTSDNLLDLWSAISRGIFAALIGIVSISLVVGGIVIMNIMLVSVTERTREIGIRKALGATKKNILWQFLVEAITLSGVGGMIGIACGFASASLVAYFSPLPYAIKVWSIAVGLGVSFVVGVFFGLYPAVQAARLDPIEALRYE